MVRLEDPHGSVTELSVPKSALIVVGPGSSVEQHQVVVHLYAAAPKPTPDDPAVEAYARLSKLREPATPHVWTRQATFEHILACREEDEEGRHHPRLSAALAHLGAGRLAVDDLKDLGEVTWAAAQRLAATPYLRRSVSWWMVLFDERYQLSPLSLLAIAEGRTRTGMALLREAWGKGATDPQWVDGDGVLAGEWIGAALGRVSLSVVVLGGAETTAGWTLPRRTRRSGRPPAALKCDQPGLASL